MLSRRVLFGAVAIVVVLGTVIVITMGDDDGSPRGGPDQPAPGATTPGPVTPVTDAYVPAPERRFVRIGTTTREQFTDAQIQELADNFDVVMFSKFHAGFDIAKHHEAARRLKDLRPDIEVYPYWSTKYWFDHDRAMGVEFDDDWYLRDNDGEVIIRTKRGEERSKYVDLTNPDYRDWALVVLASWLDAAPYAGVSFDAAEPIGDFGEEDIELWDELLGPDQIRAYNDGMRDLLQRAHELVGADRKVVYNGFAPNERRGPARNLDLLELTDGALTERFCIGPQGQPEGIAADLAIMRDHPDKQLFIRSGYRDSFGDRERYQRFCFGAFLLGWEPGRSYYQFGDDYTAAQLDDPEPDLDVNVGSPSGTAEQDGTLEWRTFEHGVVFVNFDDQSVSVAAPDALTQVQGGREVASLDAGDSVTVPAHDAVFLLRVAAGG